MNYRQALDYLYRYINYEQDRSVHYGPETFSLARMEQLLERLGHPQRDYKSVHVAGTKGKGSTCRMVESVLRAAGYSTGLFTSPHLHTFCERIQVSGEMIDRGAAAALVDELEPHIAAVPGLTYFEIVTAMGLLHFARQKVDLAVVEVGLGGRLDATNVVTPLVSVITSLSYDHTAWLGDTLGQIAFEKAGIIKPGVPVVSAPQPPEALAVIERIAAERKSPLVLVGRDWLYAPGQIEPDGQSFARVRPDWYKSFQPAPEFYWIPLLGRHQIINATMALAVLDMLRSHRFAISPSAVTQGLRQVHWPARLQVLCREPLVIVDGAHNGESAERLRAALLEWFPDREWRLVFGASSDKDFGAMFDALLPLAARLILTRARSPRAADLDKLEAMAAPRSVQIQKAAGVAESLEWALRGANDHTGVIVTGSLYVAAEALEAWAARVGAPPLESDDAEDNHARS